MANNMTSFLVYIAMLSLLCAGLALCAQAPEPAPCATVIVNVSPCLSYILKTSSSPSDSCCGGIKNVALMASSHENMVGVCNCLKTNLAGFKYDPALVAELPQKCSVNLSLPPISKDTDCSK
ncbi:putative non-specific lipid-transfer protein 2 [Bienertia sinuspersici]